MISGTREVSHPSGMTIVLMVSNRLGYNLDKLYLYIIQERPMELSLNRQEIFRKHIALPQDHGSWVFLLSPLIIGLFAGGKWSTSSLFLVLAALAAFLLRQPVTIAVKAYSGRRSRRELPAARFWVLVYTGLGLVGIAGLAVRGYAYLLYVALPAGLVFAWHLFLVSRRSERRQMGVELVGSGVLALAAPAAFWVGQARPDPLGWWLFLLAWLQSAASIVYAYLRLEQRALTAVPEISNRIRMGGRALSYASFNLLFVGGLGLAGVLPDWLFLPYALQWAETVYGTLRPAVGFKPAAVGIRQLIVSSLFTIFFVVAWLM